MLKLGKSVPFEDEIEKATNENNLTEDWALIMQICDNAINYQEGAKFCLKAIMKRLHHNVPRVVIQTLTLLDSCVKNCDRKFLLQVASNEFITEVRKLLGKMHPSAAMTIKELIQKWSLEEFKDDPELCIIPAFYYKLKSEGAEFPSTVKEKKPTVPICTDPDVVTSQEEENDIIKAIEISLKDTGRYDMPSDFGSSGSEFSSKVLPEPFKVRALYDFQAAEDNELTIKTDEIVMVSDNSNANWWKGSNHRGEGLFPANFVTEDLEAKSEEVPEQEISVTESLPDTTFSGEVKLNEDKIETVICWLNETDPAEELPDPPDMLRLEDEVYKMGPLIEDNLQKIDKKLAMLNLVNEKIMASFDLFHSLSDNWSTLPSNMKYSAEHQSFGTMSLPQQQLPPTTMSTMHPNMQTFQSQPMMYIPVPTSASQFPTTGNQVNNQPTSTVQSQALNTAQPSNQTQVPVSSIASQEFQTESGNSDNKVSSVANPTPTSHEGHPPVMMHPYPINAPGGFYLPQPMPLPYTQFPPNTGNLPPQGYVQGPVNIPNFMNIPFPAQPMGQYVPFPYYYPTSNTNPNQMNPQPAQQNSNQEGATSSQTSTLNEESAAASTNQQYSSYSNDLQTLNASGSSCKDQCLKQELSPDSSNHATGDSLAPLEPVQVSKQM